MQSHDLSGLVQSALEDLKGADILEIDVRGKTSIADLMIIVTGTSVRHVRSLADNVRLKCKDLGHVPLGVEGDSQSDWVLVDLGDIIVHVMTDEKREFYALEKLWAVNSEANVI